MSVLAKDALEAHMNLRTRSILLLPIIFGFSSCGADQVTTPARRSSVPVSSAVSAPASPTPSGRPDTPSGNQSAVTPPNDGGGQEQVVVLAPGEGTSSSANAFLVKVTWDKGPVSGSESVARFTFATPNRYRPKSVTDVQFKAKMKTMGHGVPTNSLVIAQDAANLHVYLVSGIYFGMSGEWEITINANVDGDSDSFVSTINAN